MIGAMASPKQLSFGTSKVHDYDLFQVPSNKREVQYSVGRDVKPMQPWISGNSKYYIFFKRTVVIIITCLFELG